MPRPRSWTDEQLIAAVAASRTPKEVHERLGVRAGKYDVMRAHIKRLGLDATRRVVTFPVGRRGRSPTSSWKAPSSRPGRCGADSSRRG